MVMNPSVKDNDITKDAPEREADSTRQEIKTLAVAAGKSVYAYVNIDGQRGFKRIAQSKNMITDIFQTAHGLFYYDRYDSLHRVSLKPCQGESPIYFSGQKPLEISTFMRQTDLNSALVVENRFLEDEPEYEVSQFDFESGMHVPITSTKAIINDATGLNGTIYYAACDSPAARDAAHNYVQLVEPGLDGNVCAEREIFESESYVERLLPTQAGVFVTTTSGNILRIRPDKVIHSVRAGERGIDAEDGFIADLATLDTVLFYSTYDGEIYAQDFSRSNSKPLLLNEGSSTATKILPTKEGLILGYENGILARLNYKTGRRKAVKRFDGNIFDIKKVNLSDVKRALYGTTQI